MKSQEEAVSQLLSQLRYEEKKRSDQLEQDQAQLLSQLPAQESVLQGLRSECQIRGQELAQQGASLAQESKIEVLAT